MFFEKPRCPETRAEFGRDVFVDLNRWEWGAFRSQDASRLFECGDSGRSTHILQIWPTNLEVGHEMLIFPTKNKPGCHNSHHLD